jgi:hypothetical protein
VGSNPTSRTEPLFVTRPAADVERVLELYKRGYNKCHIARECGIPRSTVRCWISPRYVRRSAPKQGCFRCDTGQPDVAAQYVYILGLYLGDGCLSPQPRDVWKLRIVQDKRYVELIERCDKAMSAISQTRVSHVPKPGCVEIVSYWKHWIHLFPQHGPGKKHERVISLAPWQQEMVSALPEEFLAGLVHSDGCRSLNVIRHKERPGPLREYAYPRYQFTNASSDIRRLFTETCEIIGVKWTRTNARNVAVSRRSDVQLLDTFIGPKS